MKNTVNQSVRRLSLAIAFALIGAVTFSQEAIKIQPKTKVQKTFINSQGFELSASVSDTTRVYQGAKGGKFIYRKSKKTGNIYKSYIKS